MIGHVHARFPDKRTPAVSKGMAAQAHSSRTAARVNFQRQESLGRTRRKGQTRVPSTHNRTQKATPYKVPGTSRLLPAALPGTGERTPLSEEAFPPLLVKELSQSRQARRSSASSDHCTGLPSGPARPAPPLGAWSSTYEREDLSRQRRSPSSSLGVRNRLQPARVSMEAMTTAFLPHRLASRSRPSATVRAACQPAAGPQATPRLMVT